MMRAAPWWCGVVVVLCAMLWVGALSEGYVMRMLGAALKCCAGLSIGYYAHRHLVMQGERIRRWDEGASAMSMRTARAVLMSACAIAVAIAV